MKSDQHSPDGFNDDKIISFEMLRARLVKSRVLGDPRLQMVLRIGTVAYDKQIGCVFLQKDRVGSVIPNKEAQGS